MKYFLYLLFITLLFSLQVGFFSHFKIGHAVPNLFLLVIIVIALHKEMEELFVVAFFSGLLLDFTSGVFFGSFTFSFLLVSLLLVMVSERVMFGDMNWKYVVGCIVGCMFMVSITVWGYNIVSYKLGWASSYIDAKVFRMLFIPEFFYNCLLVGPIYYSISIIRSYIRSQERRIINY